MKSITTLLAASLTCASLADTIRMRNGTEYEGEVVSEQDDHYVVKIQVTKSIRDERKIPKNEVLEIVAEKKDEVAYEKIKDLVPTPDLLTVEDYDTRISAVESFLRTYKDSSYVKDADKILEVLDAEQGELAKGGIKFEGKMIHASDRESRAYPLDARIAASRVTSLANAGDTIGALRAWSVLEDDYSSSTAYRETIPFALKLMQAQLSYVNRNLETIDQRIEKREDGLAQIPVRDRERSKQAIDEQTAAYEARIAKEKKDGVDWLTLDPYHKDPLNEAKRKLEQEIQKLRKLDPSSLPDGDEAWSEAWKTVNGAADRAATTNAIAAARSARLPAKYISMLEARAPKN